MGAVDHARSLPNSTMFRQCSKKKNNYKFSPIFTLVTLIFIKSIFLIIYLCIQRLFVYFFNKKYSHKAPHKILIPCAAARKHQRAVCRKQLQAGSSGYDFIKTSRDLLRKEVRSL